MKTIEEIEQKIKNVDWFINNHKKQVFFYTNEEFDAAKSVEYLIKIKELQAKKSILEWVLK